MMQIKEIIKEIECFAPLKYQESYDNCGIQVGNPEWEADKVLICLEVTEEVIDEAIEINCNFILCHHPLIFSGLKSITGKNYIERTIIKAIQNNILIYAAHTNLDNVQKGVNHKIANKLNLKNQRILQPTNGNLLKLATFVPLKQFKKVRNVLFKAGAGQISEYSECSFSYEGTGTFKPSKITHPTIGKAGGPREEVQEMKIEVILPEYLKTNIISELKNAHPYEEVAYDLIKLENENQTIGAGMIGDLETALPAQEFLKILKQEMKTNCIRHTALPDQPIQKVALCGGSGSFLLPQAMRQKADILITGDFKYHEFFAAENKIIIADIGHFESEQFTIEIFSEIIRKKFRNFATLFTKHNTNPINYYF